MSDADDLTTRVGILRGVVNKYRDRYGDLDEFEPLERLDHAVAARHARLKQLRKMADKIGSEIQTVETELTGIQRGIEALLGQVLPRIERQFEEAWSPTPVLGFRLWALSDNEFHGVRTHWEQPQLTASCTSSSTRSEIPHSDGSCGRLGCGIYAAKSVERLLGEFAPALSSSFAVGLVGLSGKVVEHEHGYRGSKAEVFAVAAVASMRAEFTDEPQRLRQLFGDARIAEESKSLPNKSALIEAVVEYLTDQERNQSPWT